MRHENSLLPQHRIRAIFAKSLAEMYAREVPLYQKMVDIVTRQNQEILKNNPGLEEELGDLSRVTEERHGAIRLGTAAEMKNIARLFKIMGMYPVDYYDLTASGLPIHSTAFRPLMKDELAKNPFRVFTSLLRLDIIAEKSPKIAELASSLLEKRNIFTVRLLELLNLAEKQGGLNENQAEEFVSQALETFRWQKKAAAPKGIYQKLLEADSLLADISCFNNPHINHLTPRTLDIDGAYTAMQQAGISMIPAIQGPPRIEAAPLLRQTSFQAYQEPIEFPDGGKAEQGFHRARFGEIEARGIALTPQGRAAYDQLLARVEARAKQKDPDYKKILEEEFKDFPKTYEDLRKKNFAYFEYRATRKGELALSPGPLPENIDFLIGKGYAKAIPITYEDFLPVSAAGIFRANLVDGNIAEVNKSYDNGKSLLEEALGMKINDSFELYQKQQEQSLAATFAKLKAR